MSFSVVPISLSCSVMSSVSLQCIAFFIDSVYYYYNYKIFVRSKTVKINFMFSTGKQHAGHMFNDCFPRQGRVKDMKYNIDPPILSSPSLKGAILIVVMNE